MFELIAYEGRNRTRTQLTEQEARSRLEGQVFDVDVAIERLVNNPYGQMTCKGGVVRYVPE